MTSISKQTARFVPQQDAFPRRAPSMSTTTSAISSSKPGFAQTLGTTRLNLTLFDISNPTHLELNLRLLYDPTFQANFGDYGLKSQDDVHRLWASNLIRQTTCPKLLEKPAAAGYVMCLKPDHESLYPMCH